MISKLLNSSVIITNYASEIAYFKIEFKEIIFQRMKELKRNVLVKDLVFLKPWASKEDSVMNHGRTTLQFAEK